MSKMIELSDPKAQELFKDRSTMKSLTCRNHPGARYSTKNLYDRSLFYFKADVDYLKSYDPEAFEKAHNGGMSDDEIARAGAFLGIECPCPLKDLVMLVPDDDDVSKFLEG